MSVIITKNGLFECALAKLIVGFDTSSVGVQVPVSYTRPPPPPPDPVPFRSTPLAHAYFPLRMSDAAAAPLAMVVSINEAVPPPVFGTVINGTSLYEAPAIVIFCAMRTPPYEMLRTFVVPSCEITAAESDPVTLATLSSSVAVPILTVTPLAIFAAVRFVQITASMVWAPLRY